MVGGPDGGSGVRLTLRQGLPGIRATVAPLQGHPTAAGAQMFCVDHGPGCHQCALRPGKGSALCCATAGA